ncbi:hypothetical protein Tco_1268796 [Tanacetum coccineum]
MYDIDYLTDSMNYIPVSLENQANPYAGDSEVTNSAAEKIPEAKDESRTSSTNSKKEETLTEPHKEKKDSSTDSLEDNPKIQAFRRELEEIALKHLGTVPENNTTSTPSVNTGSQTVNTNRLDHDDSLMPELEIFHKPETGIFDEASYDEEGVITDFNSLPTEIEVSPTPTLDEAKDDEPTKKSGKRRKRMARKGLHKDLDKDDSEDSDEVGEQEESVTDDLTELYRIVMNRYGMDGPEDELEKVFWKYLKNMFEEPLSTDPIWSLLGGKPDEDCYKMLKMMEKQAGIRKHKDWLVQEQTALGKDFSNPFYG